MLGVQGFVLAVCPWPFLSAGHRVYRHCCQVSGPGQTLRVSDLHTLLRALLFCLEGRAKGLVPMRLLSGLCCFQMCALNTLVQMSSHRAGVSGHMHLKCWQRPQIS